MNLTHQLWVLLIEGLKRQILGDLSVIWRHTSGWMGIGLVCNVEKVASPSPTQACSGG